MTETKQDKLQKITIGVSDFKKVIDSGTLFVDKTAKLADLVEKDKVFFVRPRRLGKSMMLSMLKELFTHGAKDNHYFDGLAVQSLWTDPNCYPVISVSLYEKSNPDTFEQDLCSAFRMAFNRAGFTEALTVESQLTDISLLLDLLFNFIKGTNFVLLIDEWDFPLSANLDNFGAYEKNREVLRKLFAWIRDVENLRFCLVTGIGRYEGTACISGQDFVDISMDPDFADLVGYTEEEVKTYFAPHIKVAANLLECSEDELLGKLKQQYDGFCFDYNAEIPIYCTWSVNNFFQRVVDKPNQQPKFWPYWMMSANAPEAIRSYLASRKVDLSFLGDLKDPGIAITQNAFDQPTSFEQVKLEFLMVQSGYLSIKTVVNPSIDNPFTRSYYCYFPNGEVEAVYANIFLHYITKRGMGDAWFKESAQKLHDSMYRQDMSAVVHWINVFLTAIPYDGWAGAKEVIFRTFICWCLLFSYTPDRIREETFNFKGRSDVEFEFDDKFYVIELKRLPAKGSKNAALKLADEAQAQIKDRKYGHNLATWQQARIKERYGLILVIAADTRQVCYWRRIELDSNQVLGSDWVESLPDPEYQVESTATENIKFTATEDSNEPTAPSAREELAVKSEGVATSELKTAGQSEGGAPSKDVTPGSVPLGAQQNMQFEIALKSCIGLASKISNPTNLVAINSEQLVAGLLPLFSTVGQAGTMLDPKWLKSFVLNTIIAATANDEPNAVNVDLDFLAVQIISSLNSLV